MTPLGNLFHQWRAGRTCFMGLGNPDYGDDGFGVQLADELTKAGIPEVVIGGAVPEQRLGKIAAQDFDYVVFLDAVDFAAPPGSLVVMGARQIQVRFPQISTHKISLSVLAEMVQANGRTKVWLVGVQPESIRQDKPVTSVVRATLEIVKELILHGESGAAILEAAGPGRKMEEYVC